MTFWVWRFLATRLVGSLTNNQFENKKHVLIVLFLGCCYTLSFCQSYYPWVRHSAQSQLLYELVDFLLLLLLRHVGRETQGCRKVQVFPDCQCSHHHIILDRRTELWVIHWFNDEVNLSQLITKFTNPILFLEFLVWHTCTTYPDRHLKFGGWGAPSIRTSPVRPAGSFLAASISRNLKENQSDLVMCLESSAHLSCWLKYIEKCLKNKLSFCIRAKQRNSRWLPTSCCSHDGIQARLHNPTIIKSKEISLQLILF